jgi:hypothetical protein
MNLKNEFKKMRTSRFILSTSILFAMTFTISSCASTYGQQQRVAIINTVDDGDTYEDPLALTHLANKLREVANNLLPKERYSVMTQESIVARLGSEDEAEKLCRESCLVELGRKVNADYIAQARIGRYSGNLTIAAHLYEVKSGTLIDNFTGESENIEGLLSIMENKAPTLFRKMPGVSNKVDTPTKHNEKVEDTYKAQSSHDYSPSYYDYSPSKNHTKSDKSNKPPSDKSNKQVELGWQRIWDMHHLRWSYGYFYNTIGYKGSGDDEYGHYTNITYEFIVGGIVRWEMSSNSFVGLFGGFGMRRYNYEIASYTYGRSELGTEFTFGIISLYIAERNFTRVGGGVGIIL